MVSGNQEQKQLIDAIMTNLKAKTINKNTTNKEVINMKKILILQLLDQFQEKKNDRANLSIYRPISRLGICSKLYGRFIL